MNKHITISLISVLAVFAQSCAPSTAVRVLSLSYEGQPEAQPINNTEKLANRFNGPKRADEETYIFPGDILTFTVELEDPNFEFISLLAIKFNGQIIRANSDDSVVSTRDCGLNICVDFPFEIQSGVTQYEVEEVKFAKISSESSVNAIIDNVSINQVEIEIYEDSIHPFVEQSVDFLNNFFENLLFHGSVSSEYWDNSFLTRTVDVVNIDGSHIDFTTPEKGKPFPFSASFGASATQIQSIYHIPRAEWFSKIMHEFNVPITMTENYERNYTTLNPVLIFNFIEKRFESVEFFSVENSIYIKIESIDYHLITLGKRTFISDFTYERIVRD
jgi:hypothetical protein